MFPARNVGVEAAWNQPLHESKGLTGLRRADGETKTSLLVHAPESAVPTNWMSLLASGRLALGTTPFKICSRVRNALPDSLFVNEAAR